MCLNDNFDPKTASFEEFEIRIKRKEEDLTVLKNIYRLRKELNTLDEIEKQSGKEARTKHENVGPEDPLSNKSPRWTGTCPGCIYNGLNPHDHE